MKNLKSGVQSIGKCVCKQLKGVWTKFTRNPQKIEKIKRSAPPEHRKVGGKMAEYTIRIVVEIPDNIPQEKIVEWANFVTSYHPFLPADNPLKDRDLEAVSCSVSTR